MTPLSNTKYPISNTQYLISNLQLPVTSHDIQLALAALVALLGFMSMAFGLYMLVVRGYTREMKILATQSARLGQKGLADEVSALVGTSAELVEAINGLVRTAAGIGVFLVLMGVFLLAGSYYILDQLTF